MADKSFWPLPPATKNKMLEAGNGESRMARVNREIDSILQSNISPADKRSQLLSLGFNEGRPFGRAAAHMLDMMVPFTATTLTSQEPFAGGQDRWRRAHDARKRYLQEAGVQTADTEYEMGANMGQELPVIDSESTSSAPYGVGFPSPKRDINKGRAGSLLYGTAAAVGLGTGAAGNYSGIPGGLYAAYKAKQNSDYTENALRSRDAYNNEYENTLTPRYNPNRTMLNPPVETLIDVLSAPFYRVTKAK
jgi:hypothetical protein